MRRRYYDSRFFPFLGDLLFDQLLNFDYETTKKELEEERKALKAKEERNDYLRTEEPLNTDIKFYHPDFVLEDGVYTYKTTVPKDLDPKEIRIDASDGQLYFGYVHKTDTGEYSTATIETIPDDLDVKSMKAVVKAGQVTITANQVVKKEGPEMESDDDIEFEIEIGK